MLTPVGRKKLQCAKKIVKEVIEYGEGKEIQHGLRKT